jgi:hypothetical protein
MDGKQIPVRRREKNIASEEVKYRRKLEHEFSLSQLFNIIYPKENICVPIYGDSPA